MKGFRQRQFLTLLQSLFFVALLARRPMVGMAWPQGPWDGFDDESRGGGQDDGMSPGENSGTYLLDNGSEGGRLPFEGTPTKGTPEPPSGPQSSTVAGLPSPPSDEGPVGLEDGGDDEEGEAETGTGGPQETELLTTESIFTTAAGDDEDAGDTNSGVERSTVGAVDGGNGGGEMNGGVTGSNGGLGLAPTPPPSSPQKCLPDKMCRTNADCGGPESKDSSDSGSKNQYSINKLSYSSGGGGGGSAATAYGYKYGGGSGGAVSGGPTDDGSAAGGDGSYRGEGGRGECVSKEKGLAANTCDCNACTIGKWCESDLDCGNLTYSCQPPRRLPGSYGLVKRGAGYRLPSGGNNGSPTVRKQCSCISAAQRLYSQLGSPVQSLIEAVREFCVNIRCSPPSESYNRNCAGLPCRVGKCKCH